jgi:hypothetical protein
MKIKSGGGINSNKVVQSRGPKVEPVAHKVNPAAAGQLGAAVQFKKPELEAGKGYQPGAVPGIGIGKATTRPDTPGPGSGRTIYGSGSQSPTPPATGMPAGRDTLGEYGPEKRRG